MRTTKKAFSGSINVLQNNFNFMVQTVYLDQFRDAFLKSDIYKNNFSYEGIEALFDYLEQLENDIEEPIEFDMVALCCEYSEYQNAVECAGDMGFFVDSDITEEEQDVQALEWLQDRKQVIEFDGGVIIRDF